MRLLDRTEAGTRPIRLLGVSVHNLCDAAEPLAGRLPFETIWSSSHLVIWSLIDQLNNQ